jgi:hypothetical protein
VASVRHLADFGHLVHGRRGKLDEAAKLFGIEYQTVQKAAQVCRAFESRMRIRDLTFTHHAIVANHPEADELLTTPVNPSPGCTIAARRDDHRTRRLGTPRARSTRYGGDSGRRGHRASGPEIRFHRVTSVQPGAWPDC